MKNKKVRLSILALVVLMVSASCTHKPYHPTKSDREWSIDHEACEAWVREGIRDEPDTYDNFDEMRLIRQCMKDKGWQWERTDLFNFKQAPAK
jgi:hypothetical protein